LEDQSMYPVIGNNKIWGIVTKSDLNKILLEQQITAQAEE
jgi:predicted transcriptional regulator